MIEVTFSGSTHETSAFGLTQWDKGRKLKIIWSDVPEKFQVHFSSRGSDEAVVAEAEGKNGEAVADIPDELLKVGTDIFVWIYLSENDSEGESVKRAVLYVRPRPKPRNILDEIEPSQQEKLELILKEIKDEIGYMRENGTDAEYVPGYVTEEAERLALKINETMNEKSVAFMLASDAHLKVGDYIGNSSVRHMSQAMRLVSGKCRLNFAAYLGDMTEGGSEKAVEDAKKEIMQVNGYLNDVFSIVPSMRCHGSEDNLHKAFYRNGKYIGSEELYSYIGRWNKNAVYPDGEKLRGYCYKDLENEKLRIICLNTSDTYGKELTPTALTALMSPVQLTWFCRALDLSSKADSAEWGIILIGHHPLDMSDNFSTALHIIEKYVAGESVDMVLSDGTNISYDYEGKNSAKILAQFHGHLHNYRVNFITESKIPLIAIPNASLYGSNFYSDPSCTNQENTEFAEAVTYEKTAGGAEDTAFCVAVIDKYSGTINVLHYGAGKDRIIVCGAVSEDTLPDGDENGNGGENQGGSGNEGDSGGTEYVYTNLVPGSKSVIDTPYSDGEGYIDNYILTSADTLYFSRGYTHTGYMPAVKTDVIRIAGGEYDGTVGNYLIVTDAEHNVLFVKTLNGYTEIDEGISFTDSGIMVFEPSEVSSADLTDMALIRISTKGIGANLIVTANEEIDASEITTVAPPMISYTNIMRFALDENGADFGTGGYKNGRIINRSGEETDKKYMTVTGYFEVEADAVLRIKGLIFDGSEGCCLCVYDADHQLLHNITVNASSQSNYGISYNNGVYTFTPSEATADMTGIAYVRFSGKGSGATVIITYDEEIV